MKTLAVVAIAVAISTTSANAQITTTFSTPQQATAFGVDPIMRVTSTFRTTVAVTEPQAMPDAKAQETARRALYGMVENECTVLSEALKAECRLSSVSILVPITLNNTAPSNAMSATAIYELKPRGAASAR
jgi:hypothetical protein